MELNLEKYNKFFITTLLKQGKKNNSEKIFRDILIKMKQGLKKNPNKLFFTTIKNKLAPQVILIQVPFKRYKKKNFLICLNKKLRFKKGIKFLVDNTNKNKLAQELIHINKNKKKNRLFQLKQNYYKEIMKNKYMMAF
jgi:ribosomal protein S7